MKGKRGQIAVFIIIGLVIVIVISVFLYLRSSTAPKAEVEVPTEVTPVKVFVERCIEQVSQAALKKIALQGGYYLPPKDSILVENYSISYYYIYPLDIKPSKEFIENEISKFIDDNLKSCTNGFKNFNNEFDIKEGEIKTKTNILPKEVGFDVDYPLEIQKGSKVFNLVRFNHDEKSVLFDMILSTHEYMAEQVKSPGNFLVSRIMDILYSKKFEINFDYEGEDSVVVIIINSESPLKRTLFESDVFAFALKYNSSTEGKEEPKIEFELFPQLEGDVGERIYYKINATGDNLQYSALTDLFNISNEGVIDFVPKPYQYGFHSVLIEISDSHNNSEYGLLGLNINKINYPPSLQGINDLSEYINTQIVLAIPAQDENWDDLTYSLVNPEQGMEIDNDGVFTWTPEKLGIYNLSVVVADGESNSTKNFLINITCRPSGTECAANNECCAGACTENEGINICS